MRSKSNGKRGELVATLAILSLIVMTVGLIFGPPAIQKAKKLLGRAEEVKTATCIYGAGGVASKSVSGAPFSCDTVFGKLTVSSIVPIAADDGSINYTIIGNFKNGNAFNQGLSFDVNSRNPDAGLSNFTPHKYVSSASGRGTEQSLNPTEEKNITGSIVTRPIWIDELCGGGKATANILVLKNGAAMGELIIDLAQYPAGACPQPTPSVVENPTPIPPTQEPVPTISAAPTGFFPTIPPGNELPCGGFLQQPCPTINLQPTLTPIPTEEGEQPGGNPAVSCPFNPTSNLKYPNCMPVTDFNIGVHNRYLTPPVKSIQGIYGTGNDRWMQGIKFRWYELMGHGCPMCPNHEQSCEYQPGIFCNVDPWPERPRAYFRDSCPSKPAEFSCHAEYPVRGVLAQEPDGAGGFYGGVGLGPNGTEEFPPGSWQYSYKIGVETAKVRLFLGAKINQDGYQFRDLSGKRWKIVRQECTGIGCPQTLTGDQVGVIPNSQGQDIVEGLKVSCGNNETYGWIIEPEGWTGERKTSCSKPTQLPSITPYPSVPPGCYRPCSEVHPHCQNGLRCVEGDSVVYYGTTADKYMTGLNECRPISGSSSLLSSSFSQSDRTLINDLSGPPIIICPPPPTLPPPPPPSITLPPPPVTFPPTTPVIDRVCSTNADCQSREYCLKPIGACSQQGICKTLEITCRNDIEDTVCGCNGVTYRYPCFAGAAGTSIAHRGVCGGGQITPPSGDHSCQTNDQCARGEYCYKGDNACFSRGYCQPKTEVCTQQYTPVCACNGRTYSSRCHAAQSGVNIIRDGECDPGFTPPPPPPDEPTLTPLPPTSGGATHTPTPTPLSGACQGTHRATNYVKDAITGQLITEFDDKPGIYGTANNRQYNNSDKPVATFKNGKYFRSNKSFVLEQNPERWSSSIKLYYNNSTGLDGWTIIRKECTDKGSTISCPDDNTLQSTPKDIIRDVKVDCGVDVEYGWVLIKNSLLTPTPQGGATVVLKNLKLRFQDIVNTPRTTQKLKVRVGLGDGLLEQTVYQFADFSYTAGGVWVGDVTFTNIPVGRSYKILTKGPLHLQRKICDVNPEEDITNAPLYRYTCEHGNIELKAGENSFDFSKILQLAGDVPLPELERAQSDTGQDGVVNSIDVLYVIDAFNKTDPDSISKADFNLDGIVTAAQDYGDVIGALSVQSDDK